LQGNNQWGGHCGSALPIHAPESGRRGFDKNFFENFEKCQKLSLSPVSTAGYLVTSGANHGNDVVKMLAVFVSPAAIK